jgi:WD40 repeat protein
MVYLLILFFFCCVLLVHEDGHTFTNLTTKENFVITSSTDGVVRIWDARTSKSPIHTILGHEG